MKAGYKQTEAGVIPENWAVTTIIDCCDYADYRGKTPPKTQSGTFLVTARNVRKGFIDYVDSQEFVPSALYDQIMRRGKPRIGDVLITTEAPLGNVAQIDREDVALAQRIIKYRPKSDALSSTYLKHYFLSDRFQQVLDDHSSGSTAKGIKGRVLHQLPVVIPPLPEQRAIATALSDVDGLLGGLDRLIAKKRDLKQAAMQQLLTGQTRLPGFQGGWEVKRLGDVATLNRLNVIPASWPSQTFVHFSLPAFDEGKSPVVELGSAIGSNKFRVPQGAVLVSKLNPRIPRVWAPLEIPEDSVASTEFLVLIPKDGVSRRFLFILCASARFCEQMELAATGTTGSHQRISPSGALTLKMFVPIDPDEQTAIAEVLTDMDAELAALTQRREKTRALKQAMMQELLTGRTRLV